MLVQLCADERRPLALLGTVILGPHTDTLGSRLRVFVRVDGAHATVAVTATQVMLIRGVPSAVTVRAGDSSRRSLVNGVAKVSCGDSIHLGGDSRFLVEEAPAEPEARSAEPRPQSAPSPRRVTTSSAPPAKRVALPVPPADLMPDAAMAEATAEQLPGASPNLPTWMWESDTMAVPLEQERALRAQAESAFASERIRFLSPFMYAGIGTARRREDGDWESLRRADGTLLCACFVVAVSQDDWSSKQKTPVVGILVLPANAAIRASFLPIRTYSPYVFAVKPSAVLMPKYASLDGKEANLLVFAPGTHGAACQALRDALAPEVRRQLLEKSTKGAARRLEER